MESQRLAKFVNTAADLIAEAYRQEFSVCLDDLELESLKDWLRGHFDPEVMSS